MSTAPVPQFLFPDTASIAQDGSLAIGGVRLLDIAAEYGTPAYVYDEQHLINRCNVAVEAFPDGVAYASKSFLCREMARLAQRCGMGLDVVSGGELFTVLSAGVDPSQIVFHGNNKSNAELAQAIEAKVGLVVIDSFDEIERIESLSPAKPVRCLLRVTPGIEAHTHEFVVTGIDDSKFGVVLGNGDAQHAVDRIRKSKAIELVGAHAHIGSNIYETFPFQKAVEVLEPFVIKNELTELCVGGGLGVAFMEGDSVPTITEWGASIQKAVQESNLPSDIRVTAEPGRSISANAAITIYTVGTIKDVPGVRKFVSIDGGMNENPRPILYGSPYEVFLPRSPEAIRPMKANIVGKLCESGDFIMKDALIPADTAVGDILATPVTGGYQYSMASNYNRIPRPPVLFVRDGDVKVAVRRETYEDLVRLDL